MPEPRYHIMFLRLYLSESPGAGVQHLEHYEAMPIVLQDTAEGQALFDSIVALVRAKNPTHVEHAKIAGLDRSP